MYAFHFLHTLVLEPKLWLPIVQMRLPNNTRTSCTFDGTPIDPTIDDSLQNMFCGISQDTLNKNVDDINIRFKTLNVKIQSGGPSVEGPPSISSLLYIDPPFPMESYYSFDFSYFHIWDRLKG